MPTPKMRKTIGQRKISSDKYHGHPHALIAAKKANIAAIGGRIRVSKQAVITAIKPPPQCAEIARMDKTLMPQPK